MRICLNVAITEMVKRNVRNESDYPEDTCPDVDDQNSVVNEGTFEWSEELQGIILSAFFYGYVSIVN